MVQYSPIIVLNKSTLINNLKEICSKLERSDEGGRGRGGRGGDDLGRESKQVKKRVSGGQAKTGKLPGVTRNVNCFKVSNEPLSYLIDTPGVMLPSLNDQEAALKMALIGSIKDHLVGEERLAEYLLSTLFHFTSKTNQTQLLLFCGARESKELLISNNHNNHNINANASSMVDTQKFLSLVARKYGLKLSASKNMEDTLQAAKLFLEKYREGYFGNFMLDILPPSNNTTPPLNNNTALPLNNNTTPSIVATKLNK